MRDARRPTSNLLPSSGAARPSGDLHLSRQYVRKLGRKTPQTFEDYREFVETRPPQVVANIALCLIHQTNYLVDQQLRRLEQDFLEHGGLRERMSRSRLQHRNRPPQP